jgi:hypothetical protein
MSDSPDHTEFQIDYPPEWEEEYQRNRVVERWVADYPEQFADPVIGILGSTRPGTLDLFAQYALMYLLRRRDGVMSVTWYDIAADYRSPTRNDARRESHWATLKEWMGSDAFEKIRDALLRADLKNSKGEPDLFCWEPETGAWFFAEAKREDGLLPHQLEWFRVCRETLGPTVVIRVYRLVPAAGAGRA